MPGRRGTLWLLSWVSRGGATWSQPVWRPFVLRQWHCPASCPTFWLRALAAVLGTVTSAESAERSSRCSGWRRTLGARPGTVPDWAKASRARYERRYGVRDGLGEPACCLVASPRSP